MIHLKIQFKNITQYSPKAYEEFLQFHRSKYRLSYLFYTATILALILFCVILQVKHHNYTLAIIFCMVLTIFFLWRYLHPIAEVSKDYESEKIQKEEKFTFIFYEKYFKVRNKLNSEMVKYPHLYRVFETPNFFYLYLDKTHALLVDKSHFTIGSSENFSHFIQKKCWLKFKKQK